VSQAAVIIVGVTTPSEDDRSQEAHSGGGDWADPLTSPDQDSADAQDVDGEQIVRASTVPARRDPPRRGSFALVGLPKIHESPQLARIRDKVSLINASFLPKVDLSSLIGSPAPAKPHRHFRVLRRKPRREALRFLGPVVDDWLQSRWFRSDPVVRASRVALRADRRLFALGEPSGAHSRDRHADRHGAFQVRPPLHDFGVTGVRLPGQSGVRDCGRGRPVSTRRRLLPTVESHLAFLLL
jgi:hypothetical protein